MFPFKHFPSPPVDIHSHVTDSFVSLGFPISILVVGRALLSHWGGHLV